MTKPSITQSQKRFNESLGALFTQESTSRRLVFLKSSSDEGVIRNGGRNGARFAPASLLSNFKRLTQSESVKTWSFDEFEVSDQAEEEANFETAQKKEAKRIKKIIDENPNCAFCQIGGGHDHIFPLLMALSDLAKKTIVINIDAHADTRTDDQASSGTPFRQFAREYTGEFKLFEIGLHPYANSFSTLSQLEKGKMEIIWRNELRENGIYAKILARLEKEIDPDTLVVFSLDADAIGAAEVPGVSAVNGDGLSRAEVLELWKIYQKVAPHPAIYGIYELNPLYDTLSALSMRTMANFLYETLNWE